MYPIDSAQLTLFTVQMRRVTAGPVCSFACDMDSFAHHMGWSGYHLAILQCSCSLPLLMFRISGLSWTNPRLEFPYANRQAPAPALLRSINTATSVLKKGGIHILSVTILCSSAIGTCRHIVSPSVTFANGQLFLSSSGSFGRSQFTSKAALPH